MLKAGPCFRDPNIYLSFECNLLLGFVLGQDGVVSFYGLFQILGNGFDSLCIPVCIDVIQAGAKFLGCNWGLDMIFHISQEVLEG